MLRKFIILTLLPLILLTGCGSKESNSTAGSAKNPTTGRTSEVDQVKQSKALEDIANGKKSDVVIVPTLFLDLGADKLPATANASTELMFVVTVRSLDSGTLSYEGMNGAQIKINALSYGSIAFKFPKPGEYKLIFTTDAGTVSTIANITAV